MKEDKAKKEAEEKVYRQLYSIFGEISRKYDKEFLDISKVFMKVSGDVTRLKEYYEGNKVMEWTYLEDMALKKNKSSTEYGCLIQSKGEKEIEKRKAFLKDFEGNQEFLNLLGR